MKNTIVVIGGAGFIGSNLIEFLLKKTNQRIVSIDNYFSGTKKNHIDDIRVSYIKGESKDLAKILKSKKKKISTIFHFGEFSRIFQSFNDVDRCIFYNLTSSYEVIKYCSQNNIKLIYSASSSKFGNNGLDEHLSPYSWTKSKNIELIKNYSKWYGLRYEIVYFYNVYGPRQITNNSMAAVIGIFETQYKKGKNLTVVKPGTQKRDFTHVYDIVRGCYLAFIKGKQSDYLLGTGKKYTILQVAKFFKTKISFINSRPGERLSSFLKDKKAQKDLGYKTTIDLKDYINNFLKNNKL